jgi:IS30 family transposase
MHRGWLHSQLPDGRSVESTARSVGKHPSTVSYWLRKHGLSPVRRAPPAPRRSPRRQLEPLVAAGLSSAEIAAAVDRSIGTVRHWLREYGLVTDRSAR